MAYQVKWVSCTGRYTTIGFKTLAAAEACVKRHEEATGRPARVVPKPVVTQSRSMRRMQHYLTMTAKR